MPNPPNPRRQKQRTVSTNSSGRPTKAKPARWSQAKPLRNQLRRKTQQLQTRTGMTAATRHRIAQYCPTMSNRVLNR